MTISKKDLLPVGFFFALITIAAVAGKTMLAQHKIDYRVVIGANVLLFFISVLSFGMIIKALRSGRAQAFQNSLMGGTMLKLFVLGTAALIYLFVAKEHRSIGAVFVAMGLYIVYTILDTGIALKANKQHGRH
jgi:hypothetical protein